MSVNAKSFMLSRPISGIVWIAAILALNGCSIFVPRDGAPRPPPGFDVNKISDAVPKAEPLSKYGNPETYEVYGKRYRVLKDAKGYRVRGWASWYGTKFHGQRTSSGEPYDMYKMTAAHKTLPLPSYVKVRNLENNREVIVKVNDRGPFHSDRVIDLSYVAALKLGVFSKGTAQVEVSVIDVNQPSSSVPSTTASSPKASGLFIQVGSFMQRENATKLHDRLEKSAYRSGIQVAKIDGLDKVFRVRVGPFEDRKTAQQVAHNLMEMGMPEAKIVSE